MNERRSDRFGRYEVLSEIGRGAMGIVYKARDPKINRIVAVKTVSLAGQPPAEQREYRDRFFREAEAAGRLSHPGIVTIFDVGEERGSRSPYIVMEYISGQTLDALLSHADHKVPLDAALQLTLELAEALDCAHGQGVVHRDLKPANILLTEDGRAKIADFGIAKLNLANVTLSGISLGTPAYMSPEQLNGDPVDGRSDLFSLGVILYTLLTGYRPFQGNSAMTVSFKVVNREPIPATVLDTELPPGTDYVVARAIAKDPNERYQRGMEMALDIQDLRAGRELWSKAKQSGSPMDAQSSAGERTKMSATNEGLAASGRSWLGHQVAGRNNMGSVLQKIQNRSLYAVALLFVAILIFAIKAGRYIVQDNEFHQKTHAAVVDSSTALNESALAKIEPISAIKPAAPLAAIPAAKVVGQTVSAKTAVGQTKSGSGRLDIEVDHKFAEAELCIWIDSRLRYTHALGTNDNKHRIVFHRAQTREFHAIQIPSGKHSLRVQVTSDAANVNQSSTVEGQFVSGKENLLQISFDRHNAMTLNLK
jgi:serine/threonine protein kinase